MMPYTYMFLEIAFTHSFPLKKITFFDTADGCLETQTRKRVLFYRKSLNLASKDKYGVNCLKTQKIRGF